MCVLRNFIYSVTCVVSIVCFLVAFLSPTFAGEARKNTNISKSPPKTTNGWKPVFKVVPHKKRWRTIAKSSALQQKLRSLTNLDYSAALEAVQFALSEVPDGKTYHWRRAKSNLSGHVMPTNVFRNVDGSLCRHLIYILNVGTYSRTIEGIACRSLNGSWKLSG